MNKIIAVLLFCVYIFKVSAVSSFIEKGQRPEIFELTDNEVAVFRVTIPDDEFTLLKEKANIKGLTPPATNLTAEIEFYKLLIPKIINQYFNHNFTEVFPDVDVKKEFSGLYIGQDGFPNIEKILGSLKYDDVSAKDFVDFDFDTHDIGEKLLVGDKYNYFDIYNQVMMKWSQYEESSETKIEPSPFLESMKQNMDTEIKTIHSKLSNITREENNEEEYEMYGDSKEFKTKNGKLSVNIAGIEKSFDKVTLSLSGEYSRYLVKPNFNVKIRGKKDLFGRSKFKLRSDLTEPTLLRSKLNSDIHKKLGLTSILANYATLYINDEYMGVFVLTDAYRLKWVEQVYGEKDTTSLYKCWGTLNSDDMNYCKNENDEFVDSEANDFEKDLVDFLETIYDAKSREDIEDIFEVDYFIKEMAIEYLLGAWDHLQLGHNYYLYKQPNGKWIYLTYDHDHSFGINLDRMYLQYIIIDLPERMKKLNLDYPNYSFSEWTQKRHLIDILILNDPTRFNQAIKEIVETVFNPATLFPHIDELKQFIKPYVEKDYTPDENGNYPVRINELGINPYTFEHWEANSEFTPVLTLQYNAYGIKYWILAKYRYVCKTYNLECDPVYLDENFKFDIDEKVAFKGYDVASINAPDLNDLIRIYGFLLDEETTSIIDEDEPISTPSFDNVVRTTPSINKSSPTETEVESTSVSNIGKEIDVDERY